MKSALPVTIVLIALLAFWYVAAALMNAPLQRDAFANAGRDGLFDRRISSAASLNMERPKLPAPHQIVSRARQARPRDRADLEAQPRLSRPDHVEETLIGFAFGSALGIGLAVLILSMRCLERSMMPWIVASQTVPIIALAPMIVVILNQFDITGIAPKAVIAAYLSFFPVTVGMVKGFAFARSAAARSHAHLFGDLGADLIEIARAGERAVLLRQHEDRRRGGAGRRGGRGGDQERGRGPGRAAAGRLLLWTDGADLGGAVRRRGAFGGARRPHRRAPSASLQRRMAFTP